MNKLTHEERRKLTLETAVRLAEEHGYLRISHLSVGAAMGKSRSIVTTHYHHIETLQAAIVQEAIRTGNLLIIAQIMVSAPLDGAKISERLRQKSMNYILARTNAAIPGIQPVHQLGTEAAG